MLNINPTTAVLLLDEFVKLRANEWIVLNAANAHVARCLIAIAKSRDLKVAGIVRRAELVAEIRELGIDFVGVESPEVPEQIRVATSAGPIRLGLDAVGGPATATVTGVLSPGAHLVSYAWLSGLPIHPQGDLIGKRLNVRAYFNGYARWTYLNTPFLLAMRDFEVEEIAPWHEGGEVWRGLRARFPDTIASHSKEQDFYFGEDLLLRRHDYILEIAGGVPVAQYVYDIVEAEGFRFPSKRRAYVRGPESRAIGDLLLISIDLSNFRLKAAVRRSSE
jgi:hypothetical protein